MKKLTAGIFTALLGLVTVNAANAAIPSTNYVDTKIGAVETAYQAADTSIRNDFAAADTTTLNSAKTYADGKVKELADGQVATNKTNIASMDTFVAPTVQMTVGEQAQATVTGAINALDARITSATSGLATDGKMTELSNRVDATETDISGLETRMGTAEGEIDALQGNVQTLTNADTTNLQAAKDYADSLASNYDAKGLAAAAEAAAKSYADGLASNYDAAGSAEAAEAAAATYTDGQIAGLEAIYETKENVSTAVQGAKDYAEDKAIEAGNDAKAYAAGLADNYDAAGAAATAQTNAIASAKSYADTELAKKVDKAQGEGAANHVVITDATGNVTTSATIEQTQVNGLSDALAAKLPVTAANNADGKYVLTATALNGTITYAWEDISRDVTE